MLKKCLFSLFLLCFLVFPSHASDTGSIFVDYHGNGNQLTDVTWSLYFIAEEGDFWDYNPTEPYEDLWASYDLTEWSQWTAYTSTAYNYINALGIAPDYKGVTDENGEMFVEDLAAGIYLLRFLPVTQDDLLYSSSPIMILMPDPEENWHQELIPKVTWREIVTSEEEEEEDEEEPEEEEKPEVETRHVRVYKMWRDDAGTTARPENLTVNLYQDALVIDTVTLNEANEWSYHWEDLPEEAVYAVLESDIPEGYQVSVAEEGNAFVITNTYAPEHHLGGGGGVGVGGGTGVAGEGYDTDVEGDDYHNDYETEVEDALTQTGLLVWPVPVLAIAGLVFLSLGLLLKGKPTNET